MSSYINSLVLSDTNYCLFEYIPRMLQVTTAVINSLSN